MPIIAPPTGDEADPEPGPRESSTAEWHRLIDASGATKRLKQLLHAEIDGPAERPGDVAP